MGAKISVMELVGELMLALLFMPILIPYAITKVVKKYTYDQLREKWQMFMYHRRHK